MVADPNRCSDCSRATVWRWPFQDRKDEAKRRADNLRTQGDHLRAEVILAACNGVNDDRPAYRLCMSCGWNSRSEGRGSRA